ncbi:MAG: aspartate/glutamate racemase family protein [Victivallaceae bacterium]|nr:aspartate/glutamate racemase family protein [Victivallaceae bacterium]
MKDKIRIVVTDSGTGGLKFCAELAGYLKRKGGCHEAELIFFNCRPADGWGYQRLGTDAERAEIFSRALFAVNENYSPDMIVIACNTLSSVYDHTDFAKSAQVPVIGIIDSGTRCAAKLLNSDAELVMLMFATPVTVGAGIHKHLLVESGIRHERLSYQECPGLPEIIVNGDKTEIAGRIAYFMDKAAGCLQGKKFAVSLFCTHFSYAVESFRAAAAGYSGFNGEIINPDAALLEQVAGYLKLEPAVSDSGGVNVKVVTKTRHSEQVKKR